jgi:ppGpp synthetase/RelA/SpoT-type nucleotidyltranferase
MKKDISKIVENLKGKRVLVYMLGAEKPSDYVVKHSSGGASGIRLEALNGGVDTIPSDKVDEFLQGEIIFLKGVLEPYGLQLERKMYDVGGAVQSYDSPIITMGMQNEFSVWGGSQPQTRFEKGGMSKGQAEVKIVNKDVDFNSNMYKGIMDDYDMDGFPNADDPNPTMSGDKESVEQIKFSDTFKKVLNTKKTLDNDLNEFVSKLQKEAPSNSVIYGRTKTPFSIFNKLVSNRLLDEKKGLKDLVGTTISFEDIRDLQRLAKLTRKGYFGKVLDFDNYYEKPNDGYRAFHFIIEQNGVPIELQLKTKRMKDINVLSHDAYKKNKLNTEYMNYLTELGDKADRGDVEAVKRFEVEMSNPTEVERKLSGGSEGHSNTTKMAQGGRIRFLNEDDSYRTSRPNSNIESDILKKINYDYLKPFFSGNLGWQTPKSKRSYSEMYLYALDDFDKNLVKHIPLKPNEHIFRYVSRESAIGGMTPLIKINLNNALIYFLIPSDEDVIQFEKKGIKAEYINIIEGKYADGGEMQITNQTMDRGRFVQNQDSILRKGGISNKVKKGIKTAKKVGKQAIKKAKPIGKKIVRNAKIGFDALAKKVAKAYEGKEVKSKYQKLYGKRYSKSEAEEVGNKVASKVYRQQQANK